jgi:arylsulfatase A-like enzyme
MIPEIVGVRPPLELYHLDADRWEQTNLAEEAELAQTQAELRQRLLRWMEDTDDPLLRGPVASPYRFDALERLRG